MTQRASDDVVAERLRLTEGQVAALRPKKGFPVQWLDRPNSAPPWFRSPKHAQKEAKRRLQRAEFTDTAKRTVQVSGRICGQRGGPKQVIIHAGPTNSGKSYDGLQMLADAGSGVYAGPLRMLAYEAYEKLQQLTGSPSSVGLITGEETINPFAPIIAATVEAAPLHGHTLVLDEGHWVSDSQRGWAWTRLALADYQHIHVLCDQSVGDVYLRLSQDGLSFDGVRHERFSQLTYAGQVNINSVPAGAAVVAFSRKAVLAIAALLKDQGRNPAVLYGALPPAARRREIQRLITGDADVIVTTDVIGHGVNLPLTDVVFAQTEKYDGTQHRMLHPWEAAQIAGRAGRYNQPGTVYKLTGLPWAKISEKVIRKGVAIANGTQPSGIDSASVQLRPTWSDLGNPQMAAELPYRVKAWQQATKLTRQQLHLQPWSTAHVEELLDDVLAAATHTEQQRLSCDTLWTIVNAPVDDDELIVHIALVASGSSKALRQVHHRVNMVKNASKKSLESMEKGAAGARDLAAMFATLPAAVLRDHDLPSKQDMLALEQQYATLIADKLHEGAYSHHGKCHCGKPKTPWFSYCESCFQRQYTRYDDDYYDDSDYYSRSSYHSSSYRDNSEWWANIRKESVEAIKQLHEGQQVTFRYKGYDRQGVITKVARTRATIHYHHKDGSEHDVVLHAARLTPVDAASTDSSAS